MAVFFFTERCAHGTNAKKQKFKETDRDHSESAALGFAALENLLYVFDGGLEVALSRAIFSVPGHCADGVVMGCFFGLAKQREAHGNKSGATSFYLLAFFLPVIEHGFYDAALSTESDAMVMLALAVEFAFIVFAMILVNRVSKNDSPIGSATQAQPLPSQPDAWVCPRCGSVSNGNFCGECGAPRESQ